MGQKKEWLYEREYQGRDLLHAGQGFHLRGLQADLQNGPTHQAGVRSLGRGIDRICHLLHQWGARHDLRGGPRPHQRGLHRQESRKLHRHQLVIGIQKALPAHHRPGKETTGSDRSWGQIRDSCRSEEGGNPGQGVLPEGQDEDDLHEAAKDEFFLEDRLLLTAREPEERTHVMGCFNNLDKESRKMVGGQPLSLLSLPSYIFRSSSSRISSPV